VLPQRPRWAARDFWAPELVRRGALTFAYYAAEARDGRRCLAVASAPRLLGPYSDHGPLLCTRVGEIDPLPVRDEEGLPWLVWKQDGNSLGRATPILAAPLTPGGMSLASPPHELFRADAPWEHGLVEAPALLRHDGMFYMLYSAGFCCGRHCSYATGVARSPTLLGPWEKRRKPILTSGASFRCPGHVSVTRGRHGEPVAAYHAYVRGDAAVDPLYPTSYDRGAYQRIQQVLLGVAIAGLAFLALLAFVAVTVTANSIRAAILARHDEVTIMQLVGAPRWMVRGPFVIEGAITGGLAGAVAGLVTFALAFAGIEAGASTFTQFAPGVTVAVGLAAAGLIFAIGVALGSGSSLMSLRRHLES
jgi:hypothetical protein